MYIDVCQVVCSEVQVFVDIIGYDQYVFQIQGVQFGNQVFGFWCIDSEVGNDDQMVQMNEFGKDGVQCCVVYFFVQFLFVVMWFSGESGVVFMLDGVMDGVSVSMIGVFLMLWFFVIIRDFGVSFLCFVVLMVVSYVGYDCLVYQGFVEFVIKGMFGDFDSLSVVYI